MLCFVSVIGFAIRTIISQWIDLAKMNVMPLKKTYKVHMFRNQTKTLGYVRNTRITRNTRDKRVQVLEILCRFAREVLNDGSLPVELFRECAVGDHLLNLLFNNDLVIGYFHETLPHQPRRALELQGHVSWLVVYDHPR